MSGMMTNAEAIETLRANYPDACFEQLRCAVDMAIKALEKPERKRGKWINIRHDNIAECDQCGITGRAWMNFCFDCGADMTGGEG